MERHADVTRQQDSAKQTPEVTFFYDGACPLCRREAQHYQKAAGSERIGFVNIAAPDFNAADYNLDANKVQRTIHAQEQGGQVHTGVDAFALIWQRLPRYRPLATAARTPGIRQLMQVGYRAFARIRPHLPGRG